MVFDFGYDDGVQTILNWFLEDYAISVDVTLRWDRSAQKDSSQFDFYDISSSHKSIFGEIMGMTKLKALTPCFFISEFGVWLGTLSDLAPLAQLSNSDEVCSKTCRKTWRENCNVWGVKLFDESPNHW